MKLLPDWRDVLSKAWSVKFMLLAIIASGAETAVAIMQPMWETQLPAGIFAALAGLLTSAAMVARLLAQREAEEDGGNK